MAWASFDHSRLATDTVTIAQGTLRGRTNGVVTSFRSIPFAAPPVGDLRWRPPAAPLAWEGVRDATRFGPSPIQPEIPGDLVEQSENCLNLNIWKPAAAKAGAKLPVMVWIYGGGFSIGSNALPTYDGTRFAERGVVLVTINYRLGNLGYFAHPALTAENPEGDLGNYGVMDAMAGLKWVKANITTFGGDPGNVTIFGQSAGGMTVNALMTSPRARGLFDKAISQSAFNHVPLRPIRGNSAQTAEQIGIEFAKSQGIEGFGPEAARALRNLPAKVIAGIADGGGTSGTMPRPMLIIDGKIIVENPTAAFAAGREAKVPYITGGTNWEASLVPLVMQAPEKTVAALGPLRDRVMRAYSGDIASVALDVKTDMMVTEPARQFARLHASHGQNAYAYSFSYLPPSQRGKLHGTPHGGEILYVFDNLKDEGFTFYDIVHPPATAQDRAIAEVAISYWINFAKTGEPGTVAGVTWPSISPDDSFMEFGPEKAEARLRFMQEKLDALEGVPDGLRLPIP